MTTSSPELAPRGMDFLYSRHRLNVATSRARCVSDRRRVARPPPGARPDAGADAARQRVLPVRGAGAGPAAEPRLTGAPISSPPDPRGEDPRAVLDLRERHVLVGAVGDPDVAGTEDHARRVADVDEHLHVGAIRLAEQRRAAPGDDLDGRRRDRPAAGGPTATRAEPNRPPVISTVAGWSRRNVVGGTGGRDRRPQFGFGVRPGLSEPDAVAPVGGDPVEHGRRPLPASDDADDRRVRQPERGHERVGLGGVAPRLVGLERLAEHEQLVERGDALAALGCVGRAARNGQPERDRAGVGDDDVEVRGLGDDRQVAGRRRPGSPRACPARRPPRTARARRAARRRAASRSPASRERPDRRQDRRRRRPSCRRRRGRTARRRGSRRPTDRPSRWPGRRAARRRDDPTGSSRRPPAPPGPADDDRQRRPGHLLAGPVRVGPDRGRVGGVTISTASPRSRSARPPRPRQPPRSR